MPRQHPDASLIRDFHEAQNRFYAGGDQSLAQAMLTDDVAWHVPGRSPIAGDHRGREEVLRYFAARRELARGTFRIAVRDVLVGDERTVVFADGRVECNGETLGWQTANVFRLADGKIAECWVLPYDLYAFDHIWSSAVGPRDDSLGSRPRFGSRASTER
ncbi:MAG TPA: nuclear transport factor 2 family protein [Solirubrobacteraceae bacterium]|nr:nuclear transport factor 2 family protein [Solirubrobacteraceae bacterium]